LNQQAELVPPLRRAGDFFSVPEQIEFFPSRKNTDPAKRVWQPA